MSVPSTTSSTGRSSRRRSGAAANPAAPALLALALLAAACVSQGAHDRAVESLRAELAEREEETRAQARSIDALEAERDQLLAEIEDLRDARESLQTELAVRDKALRELRSTYDALVDELEADVAAGQARIEQLTEGLSFRLPQDVLFPPGSAELSANGRRAVAEIADRIRGRDGLVEVHGHTDDRPILGALAQRYPTNWELAGARAAAVVRVLEESGLDPKLLEAVSFGPTRPLVSNETAEGRAQNRRIEVRVVPSPTAPLAQPAGAEAGAERTPDAASRPAADARAAAGAERGEAGDGLPDVESAPPAQREEEAPPPEGEGAPDLDAEAPAPARE